MNNIAQQELHDLVVEDVTLAFNKVKKKDENDPIVAFALGFVEDICGYYISALTLSNAHTLYNDSPDEQEFLQYWWFPSEWSEEVEGLEDSDAVHALLIQQQDALDEADDEANQQLKDDYINTVIAALKTCDKQGVFGSGAERENIAVFLHSLDSSDEELDDQSSEQINSADLHNAFSRRFDWEGNDEQSISTTLLKRVKAL